MSSLPCSKACTGPPPRSRYTWAPISQPGNELVDGEADGYDDEKGDKVDDALGRSSILKLLPLKARHCSSL